MVRPLAYADRARYVAQYRAMMDAVLAALGIMSVVVEGLRFDEKKCALPAELFATEEVYRLVEKGMPFRDAYRKIAEKYK